MKKYIKIKYLLIILLITIISLNCFTQYRVKYFIGGEISENYSKSEDLDSIITIATFNTALLYSDFFKVRYFEPNPYSKERLKILPDYLSNLNIDIIGLQEIYHESDKMYLIEALKSDYPYSIYYVPNWNFGFGFNNGELFLSKIPILKSRFSLYKNNPLSEKILTDKGVLSIVIEISGYRCVITNTHTTVGGGYYKTESNKANSIRNKQVAQVINQTHSLNENIQIILGDFNAGPGVSEINYQQLLDSDFVDTYALICNYNCVDLTWDPKNVLNENSHFPDSPPQRIDNIFIDKKSLDRFKIADEKIILKDNILKIDSITIPLSDHYGYSCTIRIKP